MLETATTPSLPPSLHLIPLGQQATATAHRLCCVRVAKLGHLATLPPSHAGHHQVAATIRSKILLRTVCCPALVNCLNPTSHPLLGFCAYSMHKAPQAEGLLFVTLHASWAKHPAAACRQSGNTATAAANVAKPPSPCHASPNQAAHAATTNAKTQGLETQGPHGYINEARVMACQRGGHATCCGEL